LPEPRIEPSRRIARTARSVGLAFVELAAMDQ
jgi:hypothetical protein